LDRMAAIAASQASSLALSSTSISVSDAAFAPAEIALQVGDTLTWRNVGSVTHLLRVEDGNPQPGLLLPGQSATHRFLAAGSFPFACEIHPALRGTVSVAKPPYRRT